MVVQASTKDDLGRPQTPMDGKQEYWDSKRHTMAGEQCYYRMGEGRGASNGPPP